jgi:hypothetical protein
MEETMFRSSTLYSGLRVGAAVSLMAVAAGAHATPFVVDAMQNSSSGGVGLASLSLTAGESFNVSASPNDLWSAGALPRFSDADGLISNRLATAADDSGQAPGTVIGVNFGTFTEANLSAPFGALVGRIDNGDYFVIGTSFSGVASASGTLNLYYWDQNNGDNFGTITANVTVGAIPEPGVYAMILAGLGMIGFMATRRRD